MERLREIAEEATLSINALPDINLSEGQQRDVAQIVEQAVIMALLEGHHRAVDAVLQCPDADQDLAHKMAKQIRLKTDALIANLSSMR